MTYANFNNKVRGADNRSQVFLARSTDGGASYSNPALVGDYDELPDCQATQGQDAGRACVPERGASKNSYFRASQSPIGAVDPTNPKRVLVTYGSYLNRNSNEGTGCTPTGLSALGLNTYRGAKDGGCNNDIIVSTSTDGAKTFSGGAIDPRMMPVVTTDNKQAKTSQFWQNSAFAPDGTFVVAYYDRQYAMTRRPATPTSACRPRPTVRPTPTAGSRRARCRHRPNSSAPSSGTTWAWR